MNDKNIATLFSALATILDNQKLIMQKFQILEYDEYYGYNTSTIDKLSKECYEIARVYSDDL